MWQAFLSTIENAWRTAWSAIAGILESARNTLSSIASAIVQAIFGAFNQDWGSIGRNIVTSIGDSLKAGLQWVAQRAREIAEAALAAAKAALGIGSPSKEFLWLGEMSVAGFGNAFKDVRPVERAVVRAIDAGLSAGAAQARNGGSSIDRSISIGTVTMPGASGPSLLRQLDAMQVHR
jgi:hypothetical protein